MDPSRPAATPRQGSTTSTRTAFFARVFLDADDDGPYVAADELAEMVAPLVDVAREPHHSNGGTTLSGSAAGLGSLLRAALADAGSSQVELLTAYLNPAEQVRQLRTTLTQLISADAPADEPDLGGQ